MKILRRFLRQSLGLAHYLFAGVFLIRLLSLARLSSSPFLLPSRGDMHFYNDWALRILHGQWTDHLAFYGLPLYAYLLAGVYRVFGYSPFVPALFQAILDAATAVLIYAIALRVFSNLREDEMVEAESATQMPRRFGLRPPEVIGVIAAGAWAFFLPAEAYSVILMPAAWLVFVFWFVVWRILRRDRPFSFREIFLLGLLIGFTAMGIATILFVLPLVAAALWMRAGDAPRFSRAFAGKFALLVAGLFLGLSPCWAHNRFLAHDPVLLSAHSGINFWIGNNPAANGYPKFPPGLRAGQAAMLQDSIDVAVATAGHPLKRSQVSAFWSAKAAGYIAQNPVQWLALVAKKFRNFWSAFQYDDLSIITNLRAQGIILPGIGFGLVAALAFPGLILANLRTPRARWITAAILLHMASLITVFVTERYRLAAVPGLLIFASAGLVYFWESWVAHDFRTALLYVAILLAGAAFVAAPQRDPSLWALDAYNSGWQALQSDNFPLAERKLILAYRYVPDNPETNFALGNLRFAQGNSAAAQNFYHTTLSFEPKHRGALNNLAVIALDHQQPKEAEDYLRSALLAEPLNAKIHFLLAKALAAQNKMAEARPEAARAVQLAPAQHEFIEMQRSLTLPP